MYFEKEDSHRIQIMRVICTTLVIFIHMNIDSLTLQNGSGSSSFPFWLQDINYIVSECIGRTAVPFFFLCSSMLLYTKKFTFMENFKKKLKTLLIPYVLCITLYILLFFIMQHLPFMSPYFSNADNKIADWTWIDWIDAYIGKLKHDKPFCVPLWFIRDLILLNLLAIPIQKIVQRLPYLTCICCFVLWIANYQTSLIDKQGIVFWIAGILAVKNTLTFRHIDKISNLIYLILPILLYLDATYKLYPIHQIFIIYYLICLLKSSHILLNSYDIIKKLAPYTLFVYMFHLLILTTMCKVALRFIMQTPVVQLTEYFFFPLMSGFVCLATAVVFQKFCPYLYNLLVGGRT